MTQSAQVAQSGRQPSNDVANTVGLGRLRLFNVAMGSLHLVQGILMVLLSSSFSLPVMTNFLYFSPNTKTLVPRPEVLLNVRLGPAIAAFLFLSSIAHFAVASPWVYPWYARNVRLGANPARWVEYSLSSSLMIVLIAMLVGIYDIAALVALFGVNASMILFGWAMERFNLGRGAVDWLAYWFGVLAGAVPWIAIGIYLFGAGTGSSSRPPTFVYFIYGSLFVFFNVFALNMVFQYRRVGRWKNVLYGERVYMVLSLVAKSALAWQVFAGTLRPN
ncbi:MAG TPA: heliorhodopsin HeR [Candidatus Nitrosotalea sp.]|nr:heliorhodopsin HeR [Candidatus Nitrosotalea sp.]